MIERVFGLLTDSLSGAIPIAVGASLLWGVLSVLLSPCHLASIPLVIGYLGSQQVKSGRHALGLSSLFAVGILITIAVIGLLTAAFGRMLGDVGAVGNYIVAGIFLVVGLHLIGLIPLPLCARGAGGIQRRGALGALILGLIFGIALGPCTFAFMAPVLAVAFSVAAGGMLFAVLLLLAYGVGHCAVIAAAGASGGSVQRYLDWSGRSDAAVWVRRVCGILVLLAGAYLVWTTF